VLLRRPVNVRAQEGGNVRRAPLMECRRPQCHVGQKPGCAPTSGRENGLDDPRFDGVGVSNRRVTHEEIGLPGVRRRLSIALNKLVTSTISGFNRLHIVVVAFCCEAVPHREERQADEGIHCCGSPYWHSRCISANINNQTRQPAVCAYFKALRLSGVDGGRLDRGHREHSRPELG
jgi:hypothetical protein